MTVSPVPGFRFAAVASGIRKDGRIDTALAVADRPVVVAGVVTKNRVKAAPVLVAEDRLRAGLSRGVLANSGCANACTGEAGLVAARRATDAVARALGAGETELLPALTGVIGALLPAERIVERAGELVLRLAPDRIEEFARAICTTDRWPKLAEGRLEGPDGRATLVGVAKGAGMIHPDLGPPHATMLAFLFTDAVIDQEALQSALERAADETFNQVTVNGDTSTNDIVLAFASGASGFRASASALSGTLHGVCSSLARSMVRDGEGAEHAVNIRVSGLATHDEARQVARTVATSLLVKTALFGRDANWGRLLAAAGRAGVAFDPNVASVVIAGVEVARGGVAVGSDAENEAQRRMAAETYTVELELGSGPGKSATVTSDIGHGYVNVNAGYRS